MTTKRYDSSKNFKLIKDGKFNINYPRGYNLATGMVDNFDYSKPNVFLPDIRRCG